MYWQALVDYGKLWEKIIPQHLPDACHQAILIPSSGWRVRRPWQMSFHAGDCATGRLLRHWFCKLAERRGPVFHQGHNCKLIMRGCCLEIVGSLSIELRAAGLQHLDTHNVSPVRNKFTKYVYQGSWQQRPFCPASFGACALACNSKLLA